MDTNKDGLDDNFDAGVIAGGAHTGVGFTPVDTDSDGVTDFQDADSDNDGISDAIEAGHGVSQALIDISADIDGDGLKDAVEGSDDEDGFDVNDENVDVLGEFTLDDTDSDVDPGRTNADPLNVDYDFREALDTDGDNVHDEQDIDDDNDGILDVDEGLSPFAVVISEGFETAPVAASGSPDHHPGPNFGLTLGPYEGDMFIGLHPALTGNPTTPGDATDSFERFSIELNNPLISGQAYDGQFQQAVGRLNNVNNQFWNVNNRGDNPGFFEVWAGNAVGDQQELIHSSSVLPGDDNQWHEETFNFSASSTFTHITVVPLGTTAATPYLLMDAFQLAVATEADSDLDGIADHLDIDSDNDGITDNVEAQTTADYIAPSGIGGTAAFVDTNKDGLDDNFDAGVIAGGAHTGAGLTPVDTDSDAVADFLDTDSDNDGTSDADEAGHGVSLALIDISGDADGDGLKDAVESDNTTDGFDVNDQNVDLLGEFTLEDTDGDVDPGRANSDPLNVDYDLSLIHI